VDTARAFQILEESLKSIGLPAGFSWGEAVSKAKGLELKVDWTAIKGSLRKYEAYRYGGKQKPEEDGSEILKLASQLRGRKFGND
jgi:hypothetical protein